MITGPFVPMKFTATEASIDIDVMNIRNPRSFKTTGDFIFESFDSLDQLIDYFNEPGTAVSMTK